jgi:hypothetical protein
MPSRSTRPDEIALDDGHAQAAVGQGAGVMLTRRAATEDDHVVVRASVRERVTQTLRELIPSLANTLRKCRPAA